MCFVSRKTGRDAHLPPRRRRSPGAERPGTVSFLAPSASVEHLWSICAPAWASPARRGRTASTAHGRHARRQQAVPADVFRHRHAPRATRVAGDLGTPGTTLNASDPGADATPQGGDRAAGLRRPARCPPGVGRRRWGGCLDGVLRVGKRRRRPHQAEAHLVGGPVTPGDEVGSHLAQEGQLLRKGRVVGAGDLDLVTGRSPAPGSSGCRPAGSGSCSRGHRGWSWLGACPG